MHWSQSVVRSVSPEYRPPAHDTHCSAPGAVENVPAGHAKQADAAVAPGVAELLPAIHAMQPGDATSPELYVPAWQSSVHGEALTATEECLPAAQGLQDDWRGLSWYVPGGQSTQFPFSSSKRVPTKQFCVGIGVGDGIGSAEGGGTGFPVGRGVGCSDGFRVLITDKAVPKVSMAGRTDITLA